MKSRYHQLISIIPRSNGGSHHLDPPREICVALAWLAGRTKTSAILTCGGREAAHATSSAMSSGVTEVCERMITGSRSKKSHTWL
jgi:hypothetical protein